MIILGIDTSCDDTGVGIVENGKRIITNVIASQHKFHVRYGGIVPSLASRQHARVFNFVLEEAIRESGLDYSDLDAIAVTSNQGLALSLTVGVAAAKTLALATNRPLLGIHHVEGHIYSCVMANDALTYPFLCLTVAGGHTMILLAHEFGRYELLGHTRDDAAGEAYDKVARRLGLGYPGGPIIDRLSQVGDPSAFRFPRPMINEGFEFSFSGLKTAVNVLIDRLEQERVEFRVEDVAASFQEAVVDVLVGKTLLALRSRGLSQVAVAGGVAANQRLRRCLEELQTAGELDVFFPPLTLCVDNGAMIAGAAYHRLNRGEYSTLRLDSVANAPLGELAVRYKPPGRYLK
jgi:tRNA N6-adenosine threonylcarbamoyltransferase